MKYSQLEPWDKLIFNSKHHLEMIEEYRQVHSRHNNKIMERRSLVILEAICNRIYERELITVKPKVDPPILTNVINPDRKPPGDRILRTCRRLSDLHGWDYNKLVIAAAQIIASAGE